MNEKDLLQVIYNEYDEVSHSEKWKNELAKDLNSIMGMIYYEFQACPNFNEVGFVTSAMKVVLRVAEFEGIKVKKIDFNRG